MEMWLGWWSCFVAVATLLLPFILFSKLPFWKRSSDSSNTSSQSESAQCVLSSPSDSSLPLPTGDYEVFLSFRGSDTRNKFADILYYYLVRSKISTFRDNEELRKGEEIGPGLIKAITQSKIYIPILSKDYASSKWCLKALAQMVKCCREEKGHIILPIFYFVEPREVRHQSGPYQTAFQQHKKKYDDKTIQNWKDALKEVGELKGWHVTDSNGQGAIVDEVFENVFSQLRKNFTLVTDELVGIDHHVEAVMKLLNVGSGGVKIVGIHGMGGIGKTTIAMVVYNKLSAHFDRCCFVEDVREILAQHEGAVTLQKKLISGILKEDFQINNTSEGIYMIKDRVCRHKVLIVLDDVDNKFEFDRILGKCDSFSSGSRLIITTRDKKVLNLFKDCQLYEPPEMSPDHSLQLFSKHAFGTDYPPEDYSILSRKIVSTAAGLPLAIMVIGLSLFGKDKAIWEDTMIQLQEIPRPKVLEKLRISYKTLNYEEQQIFLDIACFFVGQNKDIAS